MSTSRRSVPDGPAFRLLLIVLVAACGWQRPLAQTTVPGGQRTIPEDRDASVRDLRFTHLTTKDGLSQASVEAILQDRRGFMWFATRNGLNRYDGNTFVRRRSRHLDSVIEHAAKGRSPKVAMRFRA